METIDQVSAHFQPENYNFLHFNYLVVLMESSPFNN